jgi:hypothetical protein
MSEKEDGAFDEEWLCPGAEDMHWMVMNVTLIKCRILLKAMLLMELLNSLMCTAVVSMVKRTI